MITENVMAREKNTFQVKFDSAGNIFSLFTGHKVCPFKSFFSLDILQVGDLKMSWRDVRLLCLITMWN